MRLYLIQHAKATSKEENPRRPLSEEGRVEAQRMARFLGRQRLRVGHLWHSGKTRAQETAAIYARAVRVESGPVARDGLAPNDSVALLLTGYESPAAVAFVNAGVVCLVRTDDGRWAVEWIVTPGLVPE